MGGPGTAAGLARLVVARFEVVRLDDGRLEARLLETARFAERLVLLAVPVLLVLVDFLIAVFFALDDLAARRDLAVRLADAFFVGMCRSFQKGGKGSRLGSCETRPNEFCGCSKKIPVDVASYRVVLASSDLIDVRKI